MFYVAVTRAKDYLHIFVPKQLYQKEMKISRFVKEMGIETSRLKPGTRIIHKKYGSGTILSTDEQRLMIQFDRLKGERRISIAFALEHDLIRLEQK